MASRVGPRSVSDATRFTSSNPHAASKSTTTTTTESSRASAAGSPRKTQQGGGSRMPGESPEQRIKRLRLAHLAAQKAQISQTDRLIDASRPIFDMAHRWTIRGIVLFTAVAGVVSVYSVWDMLRYNRARRGEWLETQKQLSEDPLSVARLAYIKGQSTPEQTALVEQANADAAARGVRLPPLMAPPEHRTHFEEHVQPVLHGPSEPREAATGRGVLGIFDGLFGGGKKQDVTATADSSGVGGPVTSGTGEVVRSVEARTKGAWEREKEHQRVGGTLDRLGMETGGQAPGPAKKGFWPW